jgi:uncharacterized RDD family membrane protein YckC
VPPGYQPYGAPGYAPYQPPMGNPATQFGQLAGFGMRLGAYLLDSLLYGLLYAIVLIPGIIALVAAFDDCSAIDGEVFCTDDDIDIGALALGVAVVVLWFFAVVFIYLRALAKSGQTWGRRIVGIKVINEHTGTPPGWGKAIGRSVFAAFISAQILYIGYLWMLWDDKKQTLHDKVAGTHVISVQR